MPERRRALAPRSKRRTGPLRLCLWLVLLPGLLSAACGIQPEGRTGSATGESPEMAPSTTVSGGAAAGGTSEAGTREMGSASEKGDPDARLIWAAGRGDAGTVERLLKEGASARARGADGRTALVSPRRTGTTWARRRCS